MRLAPGKPYSPSLVEQDRLAILAAYNDQGFLQTQVSVRTGAPDKENSYPIEFQIQEGTQSFVDRIIVLGNEHTRRSVVQKKIKLKEDEPLSLSKLLQTQQGLYGLGVFDQVRVAPQNADSSAPYQDVVVRLQESKRFTVRYGFGYQEREKLRGTLEFSDLNIFGSARRADIRLRGSSIEQQALFNLQQPHFRALPVESYFTFSALQRKDISFDSRRFNASYQYSHPYSDHAWAMFRYNFKNVRVFNAQVPISELGRENEPVNLSTFSAAFITDTRDDYLDPSKGFFSSTNLGVTTKLLGDNDYISFFSQNSYFRKLPESLLLAASVRLGLAHPYGGDPDLPISERFFAGGGSSLRGFDTDYAGPLDPQANKPVGGNALVVGSIEMRVPIISFIRLAEFYDTGNVFREIGDVRFSGFSHTLGVGLRIKTPFGPLRADYGYNLNLSSDLRLRGLTRGRLFITVGPPF
jgi:outer membrane protein insertion porin family